MPESGDAVVDLGGKLSYSLRSMLLRCVSCGQENPPDATFCGECGAPLASKPPCPRCGRTNPRDLQFCRGCGTRLIGAAAPLSSLPATATLPTSLAAGRYQIQRLLGEGSKKRVYLAHDTRLDRQVALALFKTESLARDGLLRKEPHRTGRGCR